MGIARAATLAQTDLHYAVKFKKKPLTGSFHTNAIGKKNKQTNKTSHIHT
jgi:hypothetical protein